jgi:transcriptional regulator with XRE-family HTH domain
VLYFCGACLWLFPIEDCGAQQFVRKIYFFGQVVCKFKNLPLDCRALLTGNLTMPKRTIFFDDNQDTTLGGRVFQAREAAGMTVAQVINRLGVRKATYMAWEADRSEPRANKLVALAGILNVSPTYLLSGLGRAKPQPPKHQQIIDELRLDIEQLEQTLKSANKMLSRIKLHAKKVK